MKLEGLQAIDVCGVLADCFEHGGEELSLQHTDFLQGVYAHSGVRKPTHRRGHLQRDNKNQSKEISVVLLQEKNLHGGTVTTLEHYSIYNFLFLKEHINFFNNLYGFCKCCKL